MADLDDFFAKKDRKKSKAKKFATPEELAKSMEEAAKKAAESKARKVTPTVAAAVSEGGVAGEQKKVEKVPDEEWKEFEEERKDYSGLKLAQLTISEQDGGEDAGGRDGGSAGDGEGESGETGTGNGKSGAWRNVESGGAADSAEKQQQQQRPGSSVYVTPGMKIMRMKKKGVAPDLKNEEFFPTLGAEQPADPSLARGKKDSTFEEVKHGGRVRASDLPSAQPLQVGNRFNSLSNDAS